MVWASFWAIFSQTLLVTLTEREREMDGRSEKARDIFPFFCPYFKSP
jgi:hypothetical protein